MPSKVDWDNPCEAYEKLRDAYYRIIGGEQEASSTYMANGQTRTFTYSKASLSDLRREMQRAQVDCEARTNGGPKFRRRAIQFG